MLFYAAKSDNMDLASVLLENGADCSITDNEGLMAVDMSSSGELRAIISRMNLSDNQVQLSAEVKARVF